MLERVEWMYERTRVLQDQYPGEALRRVHTELFLMRADLDEALREVMGR
jgi:hypothetical protein